MGLFSDMTRRKNELITHHKGILKNKFGKEDAPESTLPSEIEQQISDIPAYEISPEAEQRLKLLQEAGTGITEAAGEAVDISRMQAGAVEAPGAAAAREDIQRSTSGQVSALQEMGGAGFLGAISQVGLGRQEARKEFAMSNLAYKSQAETGLMSALRNQAQAEQQASMLEAQGLEGMIAEKDKVYQSELAKAQTGLQFDITKLSMEQQKRASEEAGRSGIFGGLFS